MAAFMSYLNQTSNFFRTKIEPGEKPTCIRRIKFIRFFTMDTFLILNLQVDSGR